MKKKTIKLSLDLIWGLKAEAKAQNEDLDIFVRYLLEFWKKTHQSGLNKEKGVFL